MLLACLLGGLPTVAADLPTTLRDLDTRPDRGNVAGSAYLTGPAYEIKRFYNEDLEISFWKGPSPFVFSLAKNDVWDRRYFGDAKQPITLEEVHRACFEGPLGRQSDLGLPNRPHALYLAYDFPCPKPVGQLRLRSRDLERAEWKAGEDSEGRLVVEATAGPAKGAFLAWLHRTRNLLVIEGEFAGLTQPITVELFRHRDTAPERTSVDALSHYGGKTGYDYSADPDNGPLPDPQAGADGPLFWVRQQFHAEKTFPQGFEYVMLAALSGLQYSTDAGNGVVGALEPFTIHEASPEALAALAGYQHELRLAAERMNESPRGALATATVAAPGRAFTLVLTIVTTRDAKDPLAVGSREVREALQQGPATLARESRLASDEAVRRWRDSRVMHYNATSCTYADQTPWHGDYHFNEGQFTDLIVEGHADTLEQRLRMFEEMLPALKRNAREAFSCDGIAFPLVHYPITSDRVVYSNVTWEWGLENTALMLQPFWQVYQYTQDLDFLRRRAYPMLREGARFYADYVQQGDDGLYHVTPTVSQEHWGFTPEYKLNRDSVGALSFIKYHLRACVEAAEMLGVDEAERARWQEIAGHLAPYPTLDTPDGPVFCDVRDAPQLLEYNITANLVMVLWAEDISLDSPPELLEMARRSYRALPNKERNMRPGYLQQIALCLGILDRPCLSPQGRVLSWPGRIHLYAGVPTGTEVNDSFAGHLAVGGFEVSAAHAGQEVRGVRITSRAGKLCRLKSPWAPGEVAVLRMPARDRVAHRMEGDTVIFPTEAGATYRVLGGPEGPLADQRFVREERVVGRWAFAGQRDNLLPDESGNGHVATLQTEPAYARIERSPDFDFAAGESFAIEARVRLPDGPPPYMAPILCSMDVKQYCFMVSEGRVKLYLSSPRGDVYSSATGRTILTDGRWHVLRGERDTAQGTISVYVDGRLEGVGADFTSGDFASPAPVTLGAYLWGDHSRYLDGEIDWVELRRLGRLTG